MMLWITALLACGKGLDLPGVTGSVTLDGETLSVDVPEGFAWETDSQIGIYLPHHGTPDCEAIGAFLSGSLSEEPDRGVIEGPGCGLLLIAGTDSGTQSWSSSDNAISLDGGGAYWNMDCLTGDGAFSWEERNGYEDWYWSEPRWLGSPTDWSTTILTQEEDWGVELELSSYQGNFNDSTASVETSGSISGGVELTVCEAMSSSSFFY